jgi:cysteine desulfurase
MGMKKIYMDYAATTPTHPDVLEEMKPYFVEEFGNPSSLHSFGRTTREKVEQARERVAASIGAEPAEIVFTSGGTESDNYAIIGGALKKKDSGDHIITTSIEHHAVLETCEFLEKQGFKVTYLPVDKYGLVDPDDVKKALTKGTILVSVMHANNEIGTVEPIAEIGAILRERDVLFHVDAVQTVGILDADVNKLQVDLLSISAHKFYGPKGIGALYIKQGIELETLIRRRGEEPVRKTFRG